MLKSQFAVINLLLVISFFTPVIGYSQIESHKTGDFTIKAEHDNTISEEMLKRYEESDSKESIEKYRKLIKEDPDCSWAVHVPKSYDESKSYGIFVFINSSDSGKSIQDRVKLMERHKLIWIGGNKSGNKIPIFQRFYLALKGADLIKKHYTIDTSRIFVSGNSGGGRAASMLAPLYPDLFTGALYIIGCDFWEDMPIPKGTYYPGFFKGFKPNMELMKKNSYAMITGSKDFNKLGTTLVYDNYKKLGFNALYIEVPEMGHAQPTYEWFDKAFIFLDKIADNEGCEKLEKLFTKKDYGALSRKCKVIMHKTPDYQEQYKKAEKYTSDLKTLAGEEAKKLVDNKPHNAKKMLTFLKQWGDMEEVQPVRDACNEMGKTYCEKLLAKPDVTPTYLKGFITTFMEMPCTDPAKEKFNELGKEHLKKLQSEKTSETKLREFVSYWQGYSCTEEVKSKLDSKASEEFEKLIANPRLTTSSLNNFIKKWNGFSVESKAMDALEEKIGKELSEISGISKAFSKKSKLKLFVTKYKGTKSADKAQKMLDAL